MTAGQIKILRSVLKEQIGRTWPLFFAQCVIQGKKLFRNTRWARNPGEESEFVMRLAIAPAIYVDLQRKTGKEKAFEATKKIVTPIALNKLLHHLKTLNLSVTDGMEQLLAYRKIFDEEGAGKFCERHYLTKNNNMCHYIVTRCIFHDFFTETGTPELTGIFCDVDRRFYEHAFPSFRFHRGDSWENTIACGRSQCDFIIERRNANAR